jgi:hypothetical protein
MRTILFLALAAPVFAQIDDHTLTISVSRNVTATPDQVVFNVSVTSPPDSALTDVVGLLAGTGITASNLSYIGGGAVVDWNFELVTPFSAMKETIAALTIAKQRIVSKTGVPSMQFRVVSQRTSAAAQSAACPLTSLVSDARREADRIASASGVRLAGIVGLSEGLNTFAIATAAARLGSFSAVIYDPLTTIPTAILRNPFPGGTIPTSNSCSMVVQFRLL